MKMGWDIRLDDIAHKLHFPKFIRTKICYWLDKRLGVYDKYEEVVLEEIMYTEYDWEAMKKDIDGV